MTKVVPASSKYFSSLQKAIDVVAKEKIYLEMIKAPGLDEVAKFQTSVIEKGLPNYYALINEKVVGWADVNCTANPRTCHRGFLGMGLIPECRGKGLGSALLERVVEHAKTTHLEKLELLVYTENLNAIELYKRYGFVQVGLIKSYRVVDGKRFDTIYMEKFLA